MTYIDNYAILAKKSYVPGYYYVTGYKTLKTMKKKYSEMVAAMKGQPHNKLMLVARNSENDIIKVYEMEE